MKLLANHIFHIQSLTLIKEIWICLFIISWITTIIVLVNFKNHGPLLVFLRIYLSIWLTDVCKYQKWWNTGLQLIIDLSIILVSLEATCMFNWTTKSMFERTYARLRALAIDIIFIGTVIFAVPRLYSNISSGVYFTHLYTLTGSCGLLLGAILHNWQEHTRNMMHFTEHCYILFLWFAVQLLSGVIKYDWFTVGIVRLIIQICCLVLWFYLIKSNNKNIKLQVRSYAT